MPRVSGRCFASPGEPRGHQMLDHDSTQRERLYRSGLHFGDSMGTLGHGQFFQEPSASTQAPEDVDGRGEGASFWLSDARSLRASAMAKCRSTYRADTSPAAMTAIDMIEPVANPDRVIGRLPIVSTSDSSTSFRIYSAAARLRHSRPQDKNVAPSRC